MRPADAGFWSPDPPLLDPEVWDAPRRIEDDDLPDHIDPGWRGGGYRPQDAEDGR